MTAVRNAEQEVRQVHNRLDMAIKAASLGVYEYDVATGEVIWDDRMYELYSKQAGKFTPTHEEWLKCIVPADRKKAKERVQQVLRKEAEFENTYRIYSEGHGIRYIKAFGEVVWDKDGSPLKMVGINFDITKIMETEKNRTTVSDIQLKIAHAESTEEVYQIVASGVHTLVGTGIVWVTAVNEGNEYLQVKSIALELAEKRKLDKELNLHIEDETFLLSDMPADDLQLFRSGKFERYPRGLGQLSTWKISKEACRVIEDRLNYKYIYKMGFVTEGKHLGGVTILSKRDLTDLSGSIETVMNLTTLALNRITSEQALHKSEEQLRSSFEQSPIGIATSDIEFKFTSANMAFCRMIGYLEKEIIGRTFKELTHPDDLEASKKFMKKLSAAEIDQFSLEKRYLKSDKTVIWGATTVKAIHDKSGKVVSYLVMVQDITDRKLSEALLSEERQKIKVLMDSIPDSVYFKDLNNRFTNANLATARKFGLVNPAELIGKSDHDFFAEEIANQADAEEYEIIHFGMPIVGREELEIWPNKPTRWVSKTKMALYDEQGAVAGTFGVIRDITERKLQEEEIRRLNADLEKKVENRTRELRLKNQELEAFTYTVSHDLKAPLRGISGYADILLQDHSDHLDEEGKGFLTKLIRSSHQLSQLIEDLLTYSRLERRPVIYTEIQVKDIVETALEQRGQEISERKVMIHTDLDEGVIKSSHELLTQIIGNYFDNALKFTRKQPLPEIWISYKEHGKTGLLSIRDNGIGFDAKYSEKIFEVFQRLQIDDMFPGTGIGLALVKKAAELLEYRVWAKGVPEKGATFNLEVIK
jgi:PAS domain S-box-containing protein